MKAKIIFFIKWILTMGIGAAIANLPKLVKLISDKLKIWQSKIKE